MGWFLFLDGEQLLFTELLYCDTMNLYSFLFYRQFFAEPGMKFVARLRNYVTGYLFLCIKCYNGLSEGAFDLVFWLDFYMTGIVDML